MLLFDKLDDGAIQVWTRPILPRGSYAIATIFTKTIGYPIKISTKLSDIGLRSSRGYNITEVFDDIFQGEFKLNQNYTRRINPTDIDLVIAREL